jgi:hypothetical protein
MDGLLIGNVVDGLERFEVDVDPPYAEHYENLNRVWWSSPTARQHILLMRLL